MNELIGGISLVFCIGFICGMLVFYYSVRNKVKTNKIIKNPRWCDSKENCNIHCCVNIPYDCKYDSRNLPNIK